MEFAVSLAEPVTPLALPGLAIGPRDLGDAAPEKKKGYEITS